MVTTDAATVPADELDALALEAGFSGVVRLAGAGGTFARSYGLADRAWEIPNTVETRFATASGTKSFTALAIMGLIEEGRLALGTTARSVLGADLPLIADDVTVEHLLAHRSGIGDYFDDDADLTAYLLPVPVHELHFTESYLAVLDGFETRFAADADFSYCNGGYVVLALIAERVAGEPFQELVQRRVFEPAGMRDSAFLRSDELPGRTARGYLQVDGVWRSNVFHLPVRGSGDGGAYTTLADVGAFWEALDAGRIVSRESVAEMTRPRSSPGTMRYGLGFWLEADGDAVQLEGCDAGVSFRSVRSSSRGWTYTVLSNTTDGAWPLARFLRDHVG